MQRQHFTFSVHGERQRNNIYLQLLTFVVDSMTSNLALISDRHNTKSAPKERISLRIPQVTVVLRHKFYSFLIIWVVLLCLHFVAALPYN